MIGAAISLRRWLLYAADRVVPPHVAALDRVLAGTVSQTISAALRLGIVDALLEAPQSTHDLARRTGVDSEALRRLLRAGTTVGLYAEADGKWALTPLGEALGPAGASVRYWATMWTQAWMEDAWRDLPATMRDAQDHFRRRKGMGMWRWFVNNPEAEAAFAKAMAERTRWEAGDIQRVLGLPAGGVLCDVGGGAGELLAELLRRDPRAAGVLVELPSVCALAQARFAELGLTERVRLVDTSFLDDPLPRGADAYLLKNIVHDWSDEAARQILERVRDAMAPEARLFVIELTLDDPVMGPVAAQIDVSMMLLCEGGRERTRAEMVALINSAGLAVRAVRRSPAGVVVFEAARP
jgi:cyclopropane fatty-acyl-phospholipid synthase-like methyltransferase/DNA-binding HxlR family transcriptional regulator